MKENPLVSIIVPIYKVSEYVDACISSACAQTYTNLEIILVDDGSPDDCPAKCDAWAMRDSRIKVIHKKNGGLSDARNAGLDIASGTYIYFLDGDDYIKSDLVETALSHMESGADLVVFNWDHIYLDASSKPHFHDLGVYTLSEENRMGFLIDRLLTYKIGWEAWNRMFRRDVIEQYHIRFADNRVIFAEDLYFSLCYCSHAKNILIIPNSLYCYRHREDSIMGQNTAVLNAGRMNELAKAVFYHYTQHDDCAELAAHFPAIHYLIIDNVASKAMYAANSLPEYCTQLRQDIGDWNFYRDSMKRLWKHSNWLCRIFPANQVAERLSITQYILDNGYAALRIRNKLIYTFSSVLNYCYAQQPEKRRKAQAIRRQKKNIFLIGTEEYGNIGDHQINESTVEFLKNCLPDHTVYEITAPEWNLNYSFWEKCIKTEDLIVFAGGGNFGDTYPGAHNLRNKVIALFPKNRKIVFPQTVFYSDSSEGRAVLKHDRTLYTKENNIILATRERVSYELAKKEFSCEVLLIPDIVLSAQVRQGELRNNRILLCLRRDIEKSMSEADRDRLMDICSSTGLLICHTDLQLDYGVKKAYRRTIIDEKFSLFRESRVLITDRLHGMVFAAITGTPCIVFSNFNHKVKGTFEWIQHLPYIRFVQSVDDVEENLQELLKMECSQYDPAPLLPYYEELAKVVKEICRK